MSQDADLLFSAAFDDQTQKFFDQFNQNVQKMQSGANDATQSIQTGAEESEFALAAVAGAVGGISAALVQMALNAARAFPALVMESTQLAAQAEVTETAMITIAEHAGLTQEAILGVRDAMVDMTFSQNSANDALIRMVGAQVDLATATKLANAALNVSTVIGQSEERTLARMTQAMFTGNQIVLRSLQLQNAMTIARQDMEKAAREEGKAISELNRVQFIANAIIKDAAKFEGAYASASAMAGIEAEELGEKVADLKRAFGAIFVPAYLTWLQLLVRYVQDARKWFEENADTVEKWGKALAGALGNLLSILEMLGGTGKTVLADVGGAILNISESLAGVFIGMEEAEKRSQNLGATILQVLIGVQAGFKGLGNYIHVFFDAVGGPVDAIKDKLIVGSKESIEVARQEVVRLAEAYSLIEPAAEDAAEGTDKVTDAVDKLAEALKEAEAEIKALNDAFLEDIEEIGIRRTREDIDRAISEARRREDIARNHQENLERIFKNAATRRSKLLEQMREDERDLINEQAEERAELERDHAEEMVDIELNYQRRLQDIRRDFEFDQKELARRNDAVGLLRLMRQTKKRLEEEKIARDRRVEDAGTEYTERLAELQAAQAREREEIRKEHAERLAEHDEWLQAQLAAAEEQRQKNLENLERSLRRQQEDVERHRQWDDEDLARKHKKELIALGQHFSQIEGFTAQHLQTLIDLNGQAIQGLEYLWEGFYKRRETEAANAMPRFGGGPTAPGGGQRGPSGPTAGWGSGTSEGDPLAEWGFQRGGFMIAQRPTTVTVGEGGAEAFMGVPLGGTINHRLSGSASLDINGVSPDMEANIKPMLYGAIQQLIKDGMGATR